MHYRTREEAELHGLGDVWDRGLAQVEKAALERASKAKARRIQVDEHGQNKTEAAWARRLDELKAAGKIKDYRFESMKLRLAGRCWYRIDFVVQRADGSLAGCEIKGVMKDDAAVKLKLAPEVFPFMDYYLVRKDRACAGGWDVRRVTRSGIGVAPVGDEWIKGGKR